MVISTILPHHNPQNTKLLFFPHLLLIEKLGCVGQYEQYVSCQPNLFDSRPNFLYAIT